MKCALAALLAASLSSILLSAQSAVWPPQPPSSFGVAGMEGMGRASSQMTTLGQQPISACPVSMHVQHRSDGNLVQTKSAHPKGAGQWLHLTLAGSASKPITRATLTVYGVSPKGRLQYAAKEEYPSSVTQTLTVSFVASANSSFSSDLWVPGMTAVQLIDLKSIQYSDGSTWNVAAGQSCQVRPDPMMLITSR
jgi:hypothetical protein